MSDRAPPLTPDLLMHAYAAGVFPMAETRGANEIFWVDPRKRGIMPLRRFHISRSLARRMRRGGFDVTINAAFEDVVAGCADREETWINDDIARVYTDLHHMGYAHSVEVWQDGMLSGGVYGVAVGAAFCAESMFSRRTDASKIALAFLVDRLIRAGFTLCDTQFLTDHLASLGGIEIDRADYKARLRRALVLHPDFTAPDPATAQDVVQRNTHTS
ncbi:leucyl/phenylalanyl-tRNA--protein transferase [Pseudaestuariivita atlantica]|uniref:Leucyl/phenylalanyl-tRNA--protein transferase n=1 Tax=Pseudaestuariivita atlantica TaxID=1317121 RepID=A0A0L1JMH9_9RHOB|nr:leucyl/phenylalanyl-tRNA--protein transferase [Pseudaestuariivita atlantica]KNG92628.1 leucyl/phenylalanyl-tRNA--protein transferase [Pseudaestuariivita atlantica]